MSRWLPPEQTGLYAQLTTETLALGLAMLLVCRRYLEPLATGLSRHRHLP